MALVDILAGDTMGRMTFFRRLGKSPYEFAVPVPLEVDGKPLKVSWMCSPYAVDWDVTAARSDRLR